MFETAVVRARAADRRLLSLSLLAHTAIVAAVLAASVASTRLPTEAPKQTMRVFYTEPPPPLGSHVEDSRPRLSGQRRAAVLHSEPTTPVAIPETIPNVPPAASPSSLTPGNDDVGVPWGKKDSIGNVDAPPAPADASGPLIAGTGGVTSPVAIHRVEPVFPPAMVRAHMGGWVVLQCIIDRSGHIRDVSVVRSSFGAFEQPAIDAVQKWVFTPGTLNRQPVDVIFELTVKFELR